MNKTSISYRWLLISASRNERIMLVGGMGFIGHHLALSLKKAGADVLVVDSLQINNIVKILSDPELDETRRSLYLNFIVESLNFFGSNGVEIQSADGRNLNELTQIFDKFKPTKAVHLAAISSAVAANKLPKLGL